MAKRYSPKLMFQVVLEVLQGDKTVGQVAKSYGVHPNTVNKWQQILLEQGAEVFAQNGTVAEYERQTYGSPRLTTELQVVYEQRVNHKVVERLLQEWELTAGQRQTRPAPSPLRQVVVMANGRANLVAQLADIGLFEIAYTDFTELLYANRQRKAYLMPILAHRCKLVYGWAVGEQANTALALTAWRRAKQTCHQYGIAYQGMIIHHDQDPVYTGYAWTEQLLLVDQARLSYALNGAKDNPVMEAFNGRFKTEGRSLFLEAATLPELQSIVAAQMHYHNTERRHSSLGYLSPLAYLRQQHGFNW